MPRTHKSLVGAKRRTYHTDTDLARATAAITRGMSYRKAQLRFKIPIAVLHRHIKRPWTRNHAGAPTVLDDYVEALFVQKLIVCGEWGYPLTILDLKMVVKGYLDRRGIQEKRFKDNMPGVDWARSFVRRHRDLISQRMCQNIKRSRAAVSPLTINSFFDELQATIEGIPASHIVNYDETNLTDDPGRKVVVVKRGTKYPERVMNSSKSSTSLMYAAAADGTLLPPYVVYKAVNMHDLWTMGGPPKARYNRSPSGWFDMDSFTDWFMKIALPYFRKLQGKKLLIGDNLSSHLSLAVIEECEKHDIAFVFLPANSTHLTQPLDVAFFRPMKISWRQILEKWKKGEGRKKATVPKESFPTLLGKLQNAILINSAKNVMAGFEKTGIFPLNRKKILDRLPKVPEPVDEAVQVVDDSLVSLLKEMRYEEPKPSKRKKKLDVAPGKSVRGCDFEDETESSDSDRDEIEAEDDGQGEAQPETPNETEASVMATAPCTSGVSEVDISDICVGKWLVVNFAPGDGRKRKRNLFLGKVTKLSGKKNFEAIFTRPTFRSDGTTFSFPTVEDRTIFDYSQVIGTVDPPEEKRRGILKFNVNSTDW